jgi:hypothetical protein
MGGQQSEQQTSQTSTVQLPPWVSDAAQQNYAFAQNVANRPLVQYGGQQVADTSPQTQQAWDLAANSGTAGQSQYDAATAGFLSAMGAGANAPQVGMQGRVGDVTPSLLANTDLSKYMNPYINDVVNTSMDKLEAQRQQSIMGNADSAVKANAFGGSRQGITDAVTNAQSAVGAGQLASQLYGQAYDTATKGAQFDIGNLLTAATGNQTAGVTQRGQDYTTAMANQSAALKGTDQTLAGATGMESLGNDALKNVLQQYSMLSEAGQGQQSQAQSIIDANKAKFAEAQGYPNEQLNTLLSSLGMTPYGKTQTTQGDTKDSYSPDYAQSALGLLSIGAGLFKSDKKAKKDITAVGTHAPSGLPVYSYRFKGQQPGTPKTVGPMAQDVQKSFPGAVANVGGTKYIAPSQIPGGGGVGGAGLLAGNNTAPPKFDTPFGPAQQAPDGNHYVQHPRTKKFMKVRQVSNAASQFV